MPIRYPLSVVLREVVAACEESRQLQVFGVGVGLDLSPFYSRSEALDLSAQTSNQALRGILNMLKRAF